MLEDDVVLGLDGKKDQSLKDSAILGSFCYRNEEPCFVVIACNVGLVMVDIAQTDQGND